MLSYKRGWCGVCVIHRIWFNRVVLGRMVALVGIVGGFVVCLYFFLKFVLELLDQQLFQLQITIAEPAVLPELQEMESINVLMY